MFNGDFQLKAIIQIIAASEGIYMQPSTLMTEAGVELDYCSFGVEAVTQPLVEFVEFLHERKVPNGLCNLSVA